MAREGFYSFKNPSWRLQDIYLYVPEKYLQWIFFRAAIDVIAAVAAGYRDLCKKKTILLFVENEWEYDWLDLNRLGLDLPSVAST